MGPTLRHIYPHKYKKYCDLAQWSRPTLCEYQNQAVCTLRLSVRVFTPLPNGGEKTQNPSSDILNLGSRKFWKFPKTSASI
jgi:hypothetical protein